MATRRTRLYRSEPHGIPICLQQDPTIGPRARKANKRSDPLSSPRRYGTDRPSRRRCHRGRLFLTRGRKMPIPLWFTMGDPHQVTRPNAISSHPSSGSVRPGPAEFQPTTREYSHMSHPRLTGLVLVLALAASSCGSSSKSSNNAVSPNGGASMSAPGSSGRTTPASQTQTPARAALMAKANAICKRLNAGIIAAINRFPTGHRGHDITRAEISAIAQQRAVVERVALIELSKLAPPASMAGDWQQILAGRRREAKIMATLAEYAEFHNLPGERSAFALLSGVQKQLAATATRDGLASCSQLT
jgi:hypothetical protein